jgi:hypothetical protein
MFNKIFLNVWRCYIRIKYIQIIFTLIIIKLLFIEIDMKYNFNYIDKKRIVFEIII